MHHPTDRITHTKAAIAVKGFLSLSNTEFKGVGTGYSHGRSVLG